MLTFQIYKRHGSHRCFGFFWNHIHNFTRTYSPFSHWSPIHTSKQFLAIFCDTKGISPLLTFCICLPNFAFYSSSKESRRTLIHVLFLKFFKRHLESSSYNSLQNIALTRFLPMVSPTIRVVAQFEYLIAYFYKTKLCSRKRQIRNTLTYFFPCPDFFYYTVILIEATNFSTSSFTTTFPLLS